MWASFGGICYSLITFKILYVERGTFTRKALFCLRSGYSFCERNFSYQIIFSSDQSIPFEMKIHETNVLGFILAFYLNKRTNPSETKWHFH